MSAKEMSTQETILQVAKDEFLKKGFKNASLRTIAKQAGVTTGAFYGYYKSKDELFSELVSDVTNALVRKYTQSHHSVTILPAEEQGPQDMSDSIQFVNWAIDYIYDHFDEFKLLICCAQGTEYEEFIHDMAQSEGAIARQYIVFLKEHGSSVKEVDEQLVHILSSGFLSAFFEIVEHDMPIERSRVYIHQLMDFYSAGWQEIVG